MNPSGWNNFQLHSVKLVESISTASANDVNAISTIGVASTSRGIPRNVSTDFNVTLAQSMFPSTIDIDVATALTGCVKCIDQPRSKVLLPCGHLLFCNDCYRKHLAENLRKYAAALKSAANHDEFPVYVQKCPACDMPVERVVAGILTI